MRKDIPVLTRINNATLKKLDEVAKKKDMNRAEFIRYCILNGIRRHKGSNNE